MSSRRFRNLPLHRAVAMNRIGDITELLKTNSVNIDEIDSETGHSPLSLAITLQQLEVVQFLLENGANVNSTVRLTDRKAPHRQPLLLLAIVSSEVERLLPLFAASRADFSAVDELGLTLCHYAVHMSGSKVLSMLIALGAPTSVRDATAMRQMPAHYAARNANASLLMALIAADADCVSADANGLTPCHIAAKNANEQLITLLIAADVPLDVPDVNGECPAHVAARNKNGLVLSRLVAAGCDVFHFDNRGETPFSLAARHGNEKLMPLMMAARATLAPDGAASTTKQEAAASTSMLPLKKPSKSQSGAASVDDWDGSGRTECHRAAAEGNVGSLRALVSCGADINAVDKKEYSVCHTAALHNDPEVLIAVLGLGADIDKFDKNGRTPCHLAVCERMHHSVVTLLNAGAKIDAHSHYGESSIFSAVALADTKILRLLLNRGADFRRADFRGQTPMHRAQAAAVVVLFALGANLNAFNNNGMLPCHLAINEVGEAFATLVAAGADLQPPDTISWKQRGGAIDRLALVIAAGGEVAAVVPSNLIDAACVQIVARQTVLMRERALQVCLGLQSLDLPALVTCEILSLMFTPLESVVKFHLVWSVVTKVKHFSREHDAWLASLLEVSFF